MSAPPLVLWRADAMGCRRVSNSRHWVLPYRRDGPNVHRGEFFLSLARAGPLADEGHPVFRYGDLGCEISGVDARLANAAWYLRIPASFAGARVQ